MKINNIEIQNFRNIENLKTDFDDVNIIYGENAQGKTNLLEAVYLFTGSKSFRGVKDSQLVQFSKDFSKIKAEFYSNKREQNAEILIKNKRSATLNGIKKSTPAMLGDDIKAVIFSPVHLSMVKDGPIERRKFIDNALCQLNSNYRNALKEYNRCLAQRNIVLKDMQQYGGLDDMLYVWNLNFAKSGSKIIYQRQKYIEALLPYAKDIFKGLSSGTEEIDLILKGSFDYENLIAAEIEEKLLDDLEKNKTVDILNKNTSVGPHRDDLEIYINGKEARIFGSQGQQRSCVIALKLAESSLLHEKTDIMPVALLDDVMSELDEKRQDYILNHIKDWQVFITCCDKNTILRLKEGKTIHLENGKIMGD
ncbi:MAG: DNA replication/repair protein RecF [Clostridiales bacterium]|nr:DNA replication/repair protein RecF [Clostridiales bacterium]